MVAGADAGSKATKAEQLGVALLDEATLTILLTGKAPESLSGFLESAPTAAS